jgi:hypothetical protein
MRRHFMYTKCFLRKWHGQIRHLSFSHNIYISHGVGEKVRMAPPGSNKMCTWFPWPQISCPRAAIRKKIAFPENEKENVATANTRYLKRCAGELSRHRFLQMKWCKAYVYSPETKERKYIHEKLGKSTQADSYAHPPTQRGTK